MTGNILKVNKSSIKEETFRFNDSMIVCIHFYGSIQGDFLIVADELTALRLSGMYKEDSVINDISKCRDGFSSLFTEALNIAAA